MKKWLLYFSLLATSQTLLAQNALELSYHYGTTIPNSPKFPSLDGPAQSVRVSFTTSNRQNFWTSLYRNARLSHSVMYQSLGNDSILGKAISWTPNLTVFLTPRKYRDVFNVNVKMGMGLAYLTRHYDVIRTPTNKAIGSALNFSGMIEATAEVRLAKRLRLQIGGGVMHYSNGGRANPNLGINIPSASVGLRWDLNVDSLHRGDFTVFKGAPNWGIDRKWHPFVLYTRGILEKGFDGPKMPVTVWSAGVWRRFKMKHKFNLGLEYVYNQASLDFQTWAGAASPSRSKATRFCFFAGHELLFGRLGFLTEGGIYLNKHYEQRSWLMARIGFNLYLRNPYTVGPGQFQVGVHIRTYFGEAEFVEFSTGCSF